MDVAAGAPAGEQLALVRAAVPRRPAGGLPDRPEVADVDPVARVLVDVPLPHLDHPFEYSVPQALADLARPGVRVKVRFAGQDVDGYLVQRLARPAQERPLTPLRRVVSPEPVLTPAVLAAARAVADRYAGSLGDVLRLAIPPRHAAAERALTAAEPAGSAGTGAAEPAGSAGTGAAAPGGVRAGEGDWAAYPALRSFLRRVERGEAPAAALQALPGQRPAADWPAALAAAADAAVSAGRGALLVLPDQRDVDRVDAALRDALGPGRHVRLTAGQGPQARYTAWLKVLRGHVRCVVGTRAAAFAPVADLGLVAVWDDGDDLLAEPRAPYPHVLEVLRIRAAAEGAALLAAGFTRTVRVQQLVETGAARAVAPAATVLRRSAPRVVLAGEEDGERDGPAARAHLPSVAWRTAKAGLERGPVLVQVPHRGYHPSLACQDCRRPARCRHCPGPLAVSGPRATPACRWCGRAEPAFTCRGCEGTRLRSSVVGARRTAEEIGRAFPGVTVRTSAGGEALAAVDPAPALVIATPGAEPVVARGYAATLLLDAWSLLDRPSLDAGQEALRRWLGAAALTRSAAEGGVVVLAGAPAEVTLPAVEALVRWDPAWFAARELADRTALGLPPAAVVARLVGTRTAVRDALAGVDLPESVERIGPIPFTGDPPPRSAAPAGSGRQASASENPAAGSGGQLPVGGKPAAGPAGNPVAAPTLTDGERRVQLLLRAPLPQSRALAAALTAVRATQSARKDPDPVHVQLDPPDLV